MIIEHKLPPKKGYVEVEVNGKRTYRNAETGVLIDEEAVAPTLDERVKTLEEASAALQAKYDTEEVDS